MWEAFRKGFLPVGKAAVHPGAVLPRKGPASLGWWAGASRWGRQKHTVKARGWIPVRGADVTEETGGPGCCPCCGTDLPRESETQETPQGPIRYAPGVVHLPQPPGCWPSSVKNQRRVREEGARSTWVPIPAPPRDSPVALSRPSSLRASTSSSVNGEKGMSKLQEQKGRGQGVPLGKDAQRGSRTKVGQCEGPEGRVPPSNSGQPPLRAPDPSGRAHSGLTGQLDCLRGFYCPSEISLANIVGRGACSALRAARCPCFRAQAHCRSEDFPFLSSSPLCLFRAPGSCFRFHHALDLARLPGIQSRASQTTCGEGPLLFL